MNAPARWLPDEVLAHLREVAGADGGSGCCVGDASDAAPRLGASPVAAAALPALSESSRYDLIEVLGQGGMGTVYRALDRQLAREVALKVVAAPATGWVDEPEARLLAEARILAHLEHPGLVPVHDLGTLPDGRVFYAMKRVQGRRLDTYAQERMANGRAELLRVFERICETVAFAHAHGVIHRDLKPENVMVGSFGEVLVLDWGLAKVRDTPIAAAAAGAPVSPTAPAAPTEPAPPQSRKSPQPILAPREGPLTSPGVALGTPGYMAPERRRGALADERSDVFALGAILHFLLTGSPRPTATAAAGAGTPGRTGGAGAAAVPKPLLAICAMATAEDAAGRYDGAAGLAADLARYSAGLRVEAFPEGLARRVGRLVRKHATPILLLLAYLLMRVLLLLFARHS
jgi:predicted Ser/Thr protein kinase